MFIYCGWIISSRFFISPSVHFYLLQLEGLREQSETSNCKVLIPKFSILDQLEEWVCLILSLPPAVLTLSLRSTKITGLFLWKSLVCIQQSTGLQRNYPASSFCCRWLRPLIFCSCGSALGRENHPLSSEDLNALQPLQLHGRTHAVMQKPWSRKLIIDWDQFGGWWPKI